MKIEIREATPTTCSFTVDGVHPYFVNALRRTLVAEVPRSVPGREVSLANSR